jgi:hypothetical protein
LLAFTPCQRARNELDQNSTFRDKHKQHNCNIQQPRKLIRKLTHIKFQTEARSSKNKKNNKNRQMRTFVLGNKALLEGER